MIYRLSVFDPHQRATIDYFGTTITAEPQFFDSPTTLDIDALFDMGIAAKAYPTPPAKNIRGEDIKLKKMPTNPHAKGANS